MNKLKMDLKSRKGITLISLVVTIIILIILASISIAMILGNNGLLNKVQTASDETKKSQATETMNLKITNIQIHSYAETQELPNLQYLADKLCEDNDMEYVLTASKEHASLDKIDVTNISSIFTKLKEYPYEFEINNSLQLASIDGVKIADNNNDGTVTLMQDQYNSILSRLSALENNSNNTNTNENYSTEEQVIGKWINEKPIYRKVISQNSYNDIDLSQLHIDSVIDINAGGYGNNGSYRKINFNAESSSYYDSWHSGIFYENNKIKFEVGSSFKAYLPQVIVFIQYTKTTDQVLTN